MTGNETEELEKRVDLKIHKCEDLLDLKIHSLDDKFEKACEIIDLRFVQQNEWRGAMNDRENKYATKEEVMNVMNLSVADIQVRIGAIDTRVWAILTGVIGGVIIYILNSAIH